MRRFLIGTCLLLILMAGLTTPATADHQTVTFAETYSAVEVTGQDDFGVDLRMDIGAIDFYDVNTKGGDFTLMVINGFTRSFEVGEPNLPKANKLLSIPFGSDLQVEVLNYEVQELNLHDLGYENPLIPVQPSLSKSDDPESVPFEFDQSLYQMDQTYILPIAEAQVLGSMRNVNIGRLSLSPVEYNPVKGTLRIYTSMEIRVNFINPDWALTEEINLKYYSPFFSPIYDKLDNYQAPTTDKDDLVTYPIKYVIVSDRMFETQLQPFIEWKTKKGFMVEVAYTDVIGSSTTAVTTYLENLYNSANPPTDPAPSFVLLVGDDQQIPAHQASGHITDLYFCEYSTPGDYFPEVYYGRFSAQNTTQLQPQIDKTLEYEQYLMPDPTYLQDITLVSGVDASHAPTWGNGQLNYGTTYYFNAAHGIYPNVWLYPASDSSGAGAAIIQTVQDGIGLYNYTAHCSHTGHADPSFTTSDVAGLTNIHEYGLGIGNCCLSNTFGDDYSTPCFGEAWLQKENGGGIGYIGGSNSTYWDEDFWWGVGNEPINVNPTYHAANLGAYDGIFHDHGEPMSKHYVTNSAIMYAGNTAVTEAGSSRTQYYWEIYHLMGDPALMTYMGIPTQNTYTLPATILITDEQIYIEAEPESYVGVSRGGVLHGAGFIDSTGSAYIDIDPFTIPGEIEVVISHQFRIPVTDTVMVIAPDGPYVIYDTHDINDITGNNDGLVDIGENILMGMQIKNVGPDDALNVSAALSTTDSYITLTDNTEAYGTIYGNDGTGYAADAFNFDVDGNTPDGHKVSFDVTVTGDARETWMSAFNVTVHAPVLQYVTLDINDATGNGNGILDPGESAELTITLENTGSGTADNVAAILSEYDTFLGITDNSSIYGTINAGATADNSADLFMVEADASCPQGYATQFTLDLSADGGYTKQIIVDITVGDRVTIYADDFSYDQGWTGLGGSGEWNIGPCVGGTGSDGSGGPDPSEDHSPSTDNKVLGNDLTPGTGGDYNSGLGMTYWVYSPVIDCEDYTSVQMRYFRWLGIEDDAYDHAYLQAFDGTSWVTLFENGSSDMNEQSWGEQFHDISQYADENPLFQIRFGIGTTDGSVQYCGWNIDDIELKGYYNGSEYKVRVQPELQSQYGPAGDQAAYALMVRNRGAFFDSYDLSYVGNWEVTFWNEAGTEEITQTDPIGSLDSGMVTVKVAIPEATPLHEYDTSAVIVTSQGNPMAKDTAFMITYSAGTPALIPWMDEFPTTTMNMQQWFSNAGANISSDCMLPPSPPYSVNLDGECDTIITQMLNLQGQTGARISYYYQRGGGGDAPEAGDNLWIQYKNNVGVWSTLNVYSGGDTVMSEFGYVNMELPTDALHSGLQIMMYTYGGGAGSDDWFVDDIMIDLPPTLGFNPAMMSETLMAGDTAEGELVINNSGEGSLYYNMSIQYMLNTSSAFAKLATGTPGEPASRDYGPEYYDQDIAKGDDNGLKGYDVTFNYGGPDDYGYYWMDSDETGGPVFDWVDISATGTDVISQLDDDSYVGPLEIGFDFPYYGTTYTQFYLGSNGIIGFSETSMNDRSEDPIPNSYAPNNIIAWMWNDLDPTDADNLDAHAYYESDGQQLVIQFVDYPEYRADPGDVVTAEIILDFKGNIKIQYHTIADGFDAVNVAVGIENQSGTDGLEVFYHSAYLHDNLAIQFSKPYEWLSLDSYSGSMLPGEADTIPCQFTTEADLEAGTYQAEIHLNTNDPEAFEAVIPADLTVINEPEYICGDADNSGTVNVSDAVIIINYVFVGGTAPDPLDAADTNCDGSVNVSDAVNIINYVFVGGNDPCDTNGDGVPDC
ncbi:MAG TPA: hypothetical protein ENO22_14770 [candidate division Zixibacteria bacterium]|nr:hypothetical protein [candidate division Zixibacteria bacterium]